MKKSTLILSMVVCGTLSHAGIVAKKINVAVPQNTNSRVDTVAGCRVAVGQWGALQIDRWTTDLGLATPMIKTAGGSELKEKAPGDVIDATGTWLVSVAMSTQSGLHQHPQAPMEGFTSGSYYFGLEGHFNNDVNKKHYGWIKVTYAASGVATIDSIAFNDVAGQSIKVGQASTTTQPPTSILSISEKDFKAYPNPAGDVLMIENKNSEKINSLIVTNISGQVIYNAAPQSANFTLSTRSFASGVYIVQMVVSGDKRRVLRFEKK